MPYALHVVEELGGPFLVAHEQTVLIPVRGWTETVNRVRKLVFILHGEGRHRLAGLSPDRYPGGVAEVPIAPGDILVIPYECRHDYLAPSPGEACRLQAFRLAFDPARVPPLPLPAAGPEPPEPEGDPDTSARAFARHAFREFRHLPGGQDAAIREALARIREEAQGRLPGYRLRVRGLCLELMTLVARRLAADPVRPGGGDVGAERRTYLVTLAKNYVLRHLEQAEEDAPPLRLADVSAHVGVSEQHLARVFKQETGRTVFDYARRARFERAKTLLSGSDHNVSEIARLTGFTSVAVFSRTFRREVGQTPTDYRRFIAGEHR